MFEKKKEAKMPKKRIQRKQLLSIIGKSHEHITILALYIGLILGIVSPDPISLKDFLIFSGAILGLSFAFMIITDDKLSKTLKPIDHHVSTPYKCKAIALLGFQTASCLFLYFTSVLFNSGDWVSTIIAAICSVMFQLLYVLEASSPQEIRWNYVLVRI